MNRSILIRRIFPFFFLILLTRSVSAQPDPCIAGAVVEMSTGEGIPGALVHDSLSGRYTTTDASGAFRICTSGKDSLLLVVSSLGFARQVIGVGPGSQTVQIVLDADPAAEEDWKGIVVTGRAGTTYDPESNRRTISGNGLASRSTATIGSILKDEPGISIQSFGPSTGRPVMRGLSGDRLLLLDNGNASGDASSISSDHAVAIDPKVISSIEVIRGPATLLYSSSAIGGLINVEGHGERFVTMHETRGHFALSGSTGMPGGNASLSLAVPFHSYAFEASGTLRRYGDVRTPTTTIQNSDAFTYSAVIGLERFDSSRHDGIHIRTYQSDYGIPGGIPGGDEDDVRINLEKYSADWQLDLGDIAGTRDVSVEGNASRYLHMEVEPNGDVGTEIGIVSAELNIRGSHSGLGAISDSGVFVAHGSFGFLKTEGLGLPGTSTFGLAVAILEHRALGSLQTTASVRLGLDNIRPESADVVRRSFGSFTYGLSLLYPSWSTAFLGFDFLHFARIPTPLELYADGPHAAGYSYEIGNATLNQETGESIELRGGIDVGPVEMTGSLYGNFFHNYIVPIPTGDTNVTVHLPVYEVAAIPARMLGGEFSLRFHPVRRLTLYIDGSHVVGWKSADNSPLRSIPAAQIRTGVEIGTGGWHAGIDGVYSAGQNRVGPFESPTTASLVLNGFAEFTFSKQRFVHSLALRIENGLNTQYDLHMSRTKELYDEMGRDVNLTYTLSF